MFKSLAESRSQITVDVSQKQRKQLGQSFTGLKTGRLLAALAIRPGQKRIIDPMAGHGDLLESVAERAHRLHLSTDELVGVEIESEAARLGKWRVKQCMQEFEIGRGHFIHGDAFAITTWNKPFHFDLVITNPPYVRYQTLSKRTKNGSTKLLNAEQIRKALEKLANKLAPSEEYQIWQCLIRSYSGLADLSVPSLLLCGLITAPLGTLALILPQSLLRRDYARIVQYFFLRFFQPLAVIQESGQRWFQDALIPVSLVVGRRLPTEQVIIPLSERRCKFPDTPFVDIEATAASEDSHVGNAFKGNDPEAEFVTWLNNPVESPLGIKLKRIPWVSQKNEVLNASSESNWFRQLEASFSYSTVITSFATTKLPVTITHYLPPDFLRNVRSLSLESIRIGQGLRTGCNQFFYVELAEDETNNVSVQVLTSSVFGRQCITVPASVLKPVLRRQSEFSNMRIHLNLLRGRLLDLRGLYLPEEQPRDNPSKLDQNQLMPDSLANYVRLAARTFLIQGETMTPIPELSAVKTNGLGPGELRDHPQMFWNNPPRMWYMLPDFAPRHLPTLCVPRVIHDKPIAILNSKPPVLVDANFSTLWCEGHDWKPESVFAILNSTWGEFCMEALGAHLGGGALKLEAMHLRQFPIPVFSDSQKKRLGQLASEAIDSQPHQTRFTHKLLMINRVVISALFQRQVSLNETQEVSSNLIALIQSLRTKRRLRYSRKQ